MNVYKFCHAVHACNSSGICRVFPDVVVYVRKMCICGDSRLVQDIVVYFRKSTQWPQER